MKRLRARLFLVVVIAACLSCAAGPDPGVVPARTGPVGGEWNLAASQRTRKLALAHVCGWFFHPDERYDRIVRTRANWQWPRLTDRGITHPWASTHHGYGVDARIEILDAIKYGLDGFCVDQSALPYLDFYATTMARWYAAEAGHEFRIALCISNWRRTVDDMFEAVKRFVEGERATKLSAPRRDLPTDAKCYPVGSESV